MSLDWVISSLALAELEYLDFMVKHKYFFNGFVDYFETDENCYNFLSGWVSFLFVNFRVGVQSFKLEYSSDSFISSIHQSHPFYYFFDLFCDH